MLSGSPKGVVSIPEAITPYFNGQPYEVAWQNEVGGLTFRSGVAPATVYVKWMPRASGVELSEEVERLRWASRYVAVPEVLEVGSDGEATWFVSRGIEGENAVSPTWVAKPLVASTALGQGLRSLHDALPVAACPFDWSLERRLGEVERRAGAGLLEGHQFDREFSGLSLSGAMVELRERPREDTVVCHGDACAPNTLLSASGQWLAHTDLGSLGLGDRWADLAVAAWSTLWNFGPGYEEVVYGAYGVEPDQKKIRYYRLLWTLE